MIRTSCWIMTICLLAALLVVGGCRRKVEQPKGEFAVHDEVDHDEHEHEHSDADEELHQEGEAALVHLDKSVQGEIDLRTANAALRSLPEVLTTTGVVLAHDDNIVKVGSRVSGRLVRLHVKVGQRVRAGDAIATLDSVELAEARAALHDAKARLDLAEKQLEYQRKLAAAGEFTQRPLEEAQNAMALAEAEVAAAQADVDRTRGQLQWAKDNLERKRKLAQVGEYQDLPYEQAKDRHAEAVQKLSSAEAELDFARQNEARLKRLQKQGIASLRSLQEAEAARRKAEAELSHAQQEEHVTRSMLEREAKIRESRLRVATEVQEAETRYLEAQKAHDEAVSRLTKAKEQLRIARQRVEREQNIFRQGIFASKELRTAEAEYQSAKVAYDSAKEALVLLGVSPRSEGRSFTSIVAPIGGTVIERPVNRGEMIRPDTVIATILDLSTVWVDADVFQKDLRRVRKGQTVRVRTEAYPDAVFRGEVTYLSGRVDKETRTVRVRTEVRNPDDKLRPDMFVTVDIEVGKTEPVLCVPSTAIQEDDTKKVVYVQTAPETFARREVKIGLQTDEWVEITAGLKAGDVVVTNGSFLLRSEQAKGGMVVHAH